MRSHRAGDTTGRYPADMARWRVTTAIVAWLGGVVVTPVACFSSGPATPDAASDAAFDSACSSVFGCDEFAIIDWRHGDASIGVRARAMLDQRCSGGSETGCHAEFAGKTNLSLTDPTFGIINVASSQLPDVLRVEPFHPDTSYLYWKVTADPRILDGSLIMPALPGLLNGTVDPDVVALVGPWIEAGAP
jgi:hypothetical protein